MDDLHQTNDPIPLELIDRYLIDELTTDERARIALWIAERPERTSLGALGSRVVPDDPSLAAAWTRMRTMISTDEDGRHRLPLGDNGRSRSITPTSMPFGNRGSTTMPVASSHPRVHHQTSRGAWVARGIGIVAAALCLVIGAFVVTRRGQPTLVARETSVGQRLRLNFPDGSTVILAPQSRIQYASDFGASDRVVQLHGQALFTVAHASGTPFVVRTGTVATRVLGTSFAVRHYATDTTTQIVVAEGRIAVGSAVFGTGDIATVHDDTQIVVSRGNSVAEELAWTEGRLVFSGTPLRDAIPALERWYGITIDVADPVLLDRRVTTTLGAESPSRAAELVAFVVEGRAELHGTHAVIHSH